MIVKLPAEELEWSLTLGKEGLSGLPHHQKPARSGFTEGWSIYPPYPIGVPFLERMIQVANTSTPPPNKD